jgi:hypothetical protein
MTTDDDAQAGMTAAIIVNKTDARLTLSPRQDWAPQTVRQHPNHTMRL